MNLYAESSAIRAWLLDEKSAQVVRHSLAAAHVVVASDLTLVEYDRVLIHAATLGEPIRTLDALHLASVWTTESARWRRNLGWIFFQNR